MIKNAHKLIMILIEIRIYIQFKSNLDRRINIGTHRQRHADRETRRERDRNTVTGTRRQADSSQIQTDRHKHTQTQSRRYNCSQIQTVRHKHTQTHTHTQTYTNIDTDRQVSRYNCSCKCFGPLASWTPHLWRLLFGRFDCEFIIRYFGLAAFLVGDFGFWAFGGEFWAFGGNLSH